ncbi:MAG TPA: nitroreductase family deazaflavin-dependent oxidoreductase [Candidatus Limnocylindrales bacterium]|nr:nitroreductase family deazaflavin-dependent oxidoreductase [Candidatus Limnocylindrales bacterium]
MPRTRDLLAPFAGWFGNTRIVTRLHPILYRALGGRGPLAHNLGMLNVILTTTGKSSGQPRDVPLYAFREGERLVVVGSKGGSDREPAWAGNLRANPRASVRVRRDQLEVVAHEAEGEERDRLWALVTAEFPTYVRYQQKTTRRIPLFVLTPIEEG